MTCEDKNQEDLYGQKSWGPEFKIYKLYMDQ